MFTKKVRKFFNCLNIDSGGNIPSARQINNPNATNKNRKRDTADDRSAEESKSSHQD